MKILWVKTDFLHPATKGGHIRTLEILRRLHRRHEIHYVALADPAQPGGPERCGDYCTRAYPIRRRVPSRNSLAFAGQLAAGLFSRLPVSIRRYQSPQMRRTIGRLREQHAFDSVVCDFLTPAPNLERLQDCVLFQHNVETVIWERHCQYAWDPLRKFYFGLQAKRMFAFERDVCRSAAHIIAVSEADAALMRARFGVSRVTAVPTGVDIDYFAPPPSSPRVADLVFVGSMDWLPNIDAVSYLVKEVLPLIWRRRPECMLAVAGRNPSPEIQALGRRDPRIQVTGTVPDIRPCLWGSLVSVAPLRIGGGTRLKIYESMAAKIAVVSTSVGAEGLECRAPDHLRIADTREAFAEACLELLEAAPVRVRLAAAAWELVASRFRWEQVARCFEETLELARGHRSG